MQPSFLSKPLLGIRRKDSSQKTGPSQRNIDWKSHPALLRGRKKIGGGGGRPRLHSISLKGRAEMESTSVTHQRSNPQRHVFPRLKWGNFQGSVAHYESTEGWPFPLSSLPLQLPLQRLSTPTGLQQNQILTAPVEKPSHGSTILTTT